MTRSQIMKMAAAGAVALGMLGMSAGAIYAASSNTTTPMDNLVNAIAKKFNLNQADVQQVFNDHHIQMQAQHQQAEKDRLAQAVKDGKLTQEQMDKIISKQDEIRSQMEANKTAMDGKTQEERRDFIKSQMESLKQWAQENNIPMQYLQFGFKHKSGGFQGRGMHGMMNADFGQQ